MADGAGANLNEKGGWKQTPGKVSDYQGNFVDPLWVGSNSLGQSQCVEGVYQAVNSLGPPNHSLATDWSSFVIPVMSSSLSAEPQRQHGNKVYENNACVCVYYAVL